MLGCLQSALIVGVGESNQIGNVPGKSALQHHAEASVNALSDAGLELGDVDGLFTARYSPLAVSEYLGIKPLYLDGTWIGGASFEAHVLHAAAAIHAGLCRVALITHGQTGRNSKIAPLTDQYGIPHGTVVDSPDPNQPHIEFELPFGMSTPPVCYALACCRYMAEYGADRTLRALGEIAVATRHWASLNPKAMHRTRLTFAEYFGSRVISWPFKLLDCCVVTDAGGAVVIAARDRAKAVRKRPILIRGAAEAQTHSIISQMPNLTTTAAVDTGRRAFSQAGVAPADIDVALLYDAFTYNVLISVEDLGFCKKGEGPDFVANQALAPGGRFPVNTNGGGLSYTHTGMYGVFLLIEAVRQLRGECGERQVKNCEVALVNGFGGMLSSASTIILTV